MADARGQAVTPEPAGNGTFADASTAAEAEADDPVKLALRLLLAIADDPLMRPSYRVASRRHIRRVAEALAVRHTGRPNLGEEAET